MAERDIAIVTATVPILETCGEVLTAETATPDVITNAYVMLANISNDAAESKIYEERAKDVGGWKGPRAFAVANKVKEAGNITSFYFKPPPVNGQEIMNFIPGQYTGIHWNVSEQEYRRNCSLSHQQYRISAKHEPESVISDHLRDSVDSVILLLTCFLLPVISLSVTLMLLH